MTIIQRFPLSGLYASISSFHVEPEDSPKENSKHIVNTVQNRPVMILSLYEISFIRSNSTEVIKKIRTESIILLTEKDAFSER